MISSRTAQAAAHATGLPPKVDAWSPGSKALVAGDEQRADREPVRERLRHRHEVRLHAELLEGEEGAGAADAGLDLVAAEQRVELAAARAPARTPASAGGRRPRPAPARAGSGRPSRRAACSAAASFGWAKRTPGSSGSNAARFAGWPVAASAPVVRPWKEPSSATIPGLPVALRAYLIAASFASAPELQKNAVPPPKRADSFSRELDLRLRPVEVRDVPEPLELRLRGRERRRVAMPERDDGDAGAEVEVALAVGVDELAAVALDEGHVGARVGRHDRFCSSVVMRAPPSRRSRLNAAARGLHGGEQLRDDPALEVALADQPLGLARLDRGATPPATSTPGTSVTKRMRSAPSPTASAAAASSAFTFSGPAASGATTGILPCGERRSTPAGSPARGAPRGRAPAAARRQSELVAEERLARRRRSPRRARR